MKRCSRSATRNGRLEDRMAGSRLAGLWLLVPGMLAAQQPTATIVTPGTVPEVTLQEAILLANRVQPGVVQAQAAIKNAAAQKKVTSGAWLPNLNANSGAGYFYAEGTAALTPTPASSSGPTRRRRRSTWVSARAGMSSPASAAATTARPRRPGSQRPRQASPMPATSSASARRSSSSRRSPGGRSSRCASRA